MLTEQGPPRASTDFRAGWALALTSAGLFMAVLDNLVVTTALPVIRRSLHASLPGLEWTVNAYTLTYAVFLLTGAALGDRFGRRRVFAAGVAVFTVGPAGAALSTSIGTLVAARAFQGLGGAMIMPLSLTPLSAAVPPARRAMALGMWGAVAGLGTALGPLVGGAITQDLSWHWIFRINVPVAVVLAPLALARLAESYGPSRRLDLPGLALASGGLLGLVWAFVRGNTTGWASPQIVTSLVAGAALLAAFVAWEARSPAPMLPLVFFRDRGFAATSAVSLLMYFGIFGMFFLLAQFLQVVQGYSPLAAGIRLLPGAAMPMLVAPLAGLACARLGDRQVMAAGMALMAGGLAWLAWVITPDVAYAQLIAPLAVVGAGIALFYPPSANIVLSSVHRENEGQASGANNAIRETGGVIGIAVLAAVFAARGGYATPATFVTGLTSALWVAAAVAGAGTIAALLVPRHLDGLAP